jgi:hypothetical protein
MSDGLIHIERHGHCTRCERALTATAVMVQAALADFWIDNGDGTSSPFGYRTRWAAVCEGCASPAEAAEAALTTSCSGCGLPLATTRNRSGRIVTVCSRACEQRIARKAKRLKKPCCCVCKVRFTSARRDARYCSSACRQWAYRLRTA